MTRRVFMAIALIGLVMVGCGEDTPPPQPPEVSAFRDALFKMRSDLTLGQSEEEYFENLRQIQFAADKAEAAVTKKQRNESSYVTLVAAQEEYRKAFECMKKLNEPKKLPIYADNLAELDRRFEDLSNKLEQAKRRTARYATNSIEYRYARNYEQEVDRDLFAVKIKRLEAFEKIKDKWSATISSLKEEKQEHWHKASELLDSLSADTQ